MTDRTKLIISTSQISRQEADKILESMCSEAPITCSLVKLFRYTTDLTTLRKVEIKNYSGVILGAINDKKINYSLLLKHWPGSSDANLEIYDDSPEQVPAPGWTNFCSEIASIYAGPERTGAWGYGKGYETIQSISVNVRKALSLPSKPATWFFDLMKWFSVISEEFHLGAAEQSPSWEGNKERHD